MWLVTTFGFFSITASDESVEDLCVRARDRGDLERLLDRIESHEGWPTPTGDPILSTPNRDYQFRVILPRYVVADVFGAELERIGYTNFKDQIDEPRHSVYLAVWAILLRIAPTRARRTRTPLRS